MSIFLKIYLDKRDNHAIIGGAAKVNSGYAISIVIILTRNIKFSAMRFDSLHLFIFFCG